MRSKLCLGQRTLREAPVSLRMYSTSTIRLAVYEDLTKRKSRRAVSKPLVVRSGTSGCDRGSTVPSRTASQPLSLRDPDIHTSASPRLSFFRRATIKHRNIVATARAEPDAGWDLDEDDEDGKHEGEDEEFELMEDLEDAMDEDYDDEYEDEFDAAFDQSYKEFMAELDKEQHEKEMRFQKDMVGNKEYQALVEEDRKVKQEKQQVMMDEVVQFDQYLKEKSGGRTNLESLAMLPEADVDRIVADYLKVRDARNAQQANAARASAPKVEMKVDEPSIKQEAPKPPPKAPGGGFGDIFEWLKAMGIDVDAALKDPAIAEMMKSQTGKDFDLDQLKGMLAEGLADEKNLGKLMMDMLAKIPDPEPGEEPVLSDDPEEMARQLSDHAWEASGLGDKEKLKKEQERMKAKADAEFEQTIAEMDGRTQAAALDPEMEEAWERIKDVDLAAELDKLVDPETGEFYEEFTGRRSLEREEDESEEEVEEGEGSPEALSSERLLEEEGEEEVAEELEASGRTEDEIVTASNHDSEVRSEVHSEQGRARGRGRQIEDEDEDEDEEEMWSQRQIEKRRRERMEEQGAANDEILEKFGSNRTVDIQDKVRAELAEAGIDSGLEQSAYRGGSSEAEEDEEEKWTQRVQNQAINEGGQAGAAPAGGVWNWSMSDAEREAAKEKLVELLKSYENIDRKIDEFARDGKIDDHLVEVTQARLSVAREAKALGYKDDEVRVEGLELLVNRLRTEVKKAQASPAMRLLNDLLELDKEAGGEGTQPLHPAVYQRMADAFQGYNRDKQQAMPTDVIACAMMIAEDGVDFLDPAQGYGLVPREHFIVEVDRLLRSSAAPEGHELDQKQVEIRKRIYVMLKQAVQYHTWGSIR